MNLLNRKIGAAALAVAASCFQPAFAQLDVNTSWTSLQSSDGSVVEGRHETGSVVVGDSIYLIGGRGIRQVQRYSTVTGQWDNLGVTPLVINHFQPVAIGEKIYILGAFTGNYPLEDNVADIHVFDTSTSTWDIEGTIPNARLRGSAAAIVRDGKIYLLGGNTLGHSGGAVAWFDEYDPATGEWRILPDAPNDRDHFYAVLASDKLVATAGRRSHTANEAGNPVMPTDVYDFSSGTWESAASVPTARAGAVSVGYGQHVLVAGGEINTTTLALDVVESYDVLTDTWQELPSMTGTRHGAGGGIVGRTFYMFSGAPTRGGASETTTAEFIELPELTTPAPVVVPEPEPEPDVEPVDTSDSTDVDTTNVDTPDTTDTTDSVVDPTPDTTTGETGGTTPRPDGEQTAPMVGGGSAGSVNLFFLMILLIWGALRRDSALNRSKG